VAVGRLDVLYRTSMGDRGQVVTPQLVRKVSLQGACSPAAGCRRSLPSPFGGCIVFQPPVYTEAHLEAVDVPAQVCLLRRAG
jgi:hypothetical protein